MEKSFENQKYNLKQYAYIGDCVWEIFVRKIAIEKTPLQNKMHIFTTKCVNAQAQADFSGLIAGILTPHELEIQKRGRNLKITINKKNNPKIHALATSFEVLAGYLYLNDKKRLEELFSALKKPVEKKMEEKD